jgi:hypothetical protein
MEFFGASALPPDLQGLESFTTLTGVDSYNRVWTRGGERVERVEVHKTPQPVKSAG